MEVSNLVNSECIADSGHYEPKSHPTMGAISPFDAMWNELIPGEKSG